MLCLVAHLCLTLCDPVDCSLPVSSVHGDSPVKNTEMGCHDLLQGIFPAQGWNPGLQHCKRILYQLSYQGSQNTGVSRVAVPFSQGIFPAQGWNPGLLHCRQSLHQLSHQGCPPKSKCLLFSELPSPSAMILEAKKSHHYFASPSICYERSAGTRCHDLSF